MSLILFWLLVGHALCDFALQNQFVALAKNRHNKLDYCGIMVANSVWPWVLTSHALIHAGAVALITDSLLFGVAELVLHWLIDFGKSDGQFDFHVDQALHVTCKFAYVAIIFWVI